MNLLARLFASRSSMTDEQAMWSVQTADDHEAFAELVRRWQEPIRRLCVRMTGDYQHGQDLAQEAFARVFAYRHRFTQGRKFSTWLWRIASNLCYDELRHAKRRGELSLENMADEPALQAVELAPDEQILEQERAELVRTALLALPETQRIVVVLREYEGLKMREIAEILSIPEGTVKWRMAEAMATLSRMLKSELNDQIPLPKPAPRPIAESIVL